MTKKLKIGITCYPSVGGSGILATELGHELAERGHEVHFISYEIPFRLDTKNTNIYFHEVAINEYELFKYPDYTLPLSVKMAEVSQKYALHILHVHYAVPHAVAAFLAQKMLGKNGPRIITTLHGTDITLLGRDPSFHPIIKHAIENSCGVTAVSHSLKEDTESLFAIKRHIEVIYNFFTPRPPSKSAEAVRAELGIAADETVVLHLSNLRPVKLIPDLLKTIATSKNREKIKLLILSGGNFTAYKKIVQKLEIEQNILVLERVLDIENYLNAADIGLYTSDHESFGLSILETMCYGKPVIATKTGGIPEVVAHEKTGYLAPVGDIKLLASHLDQLIEKPEQRIAFGKNGAERAKKYFSAEKIVTEYLSFYEKILTACL